MMFHAPRIPRAGHVGWCCLAMLWLVFGAGCRKQGPKDSGLPELPVVPSESEAQSKGGISLTLRDVVGFQRSVWSKKPFMETVSGDPSFQAIEGLVKKMASTGATQDSVRDYLAHVYSGNVLRTAKAVSFR